MTRAGSAASTTAHLPPLLRHGHALFLDVDGTLLELAERPDDVVVPPDLARVLSRLCTQLAGAVALISGRSLASLRQLFPSLVLPMIGSHGAESSLRDGEPVPALPPQVLTACREAVTAWPGTLLEVKPAGVAMHWRRNPAARPALLALATKLAHQADLADLRPIHGHCVVELQSTPIDKCYALAAAMREAPFLGKLPVMVGDDQPDFAAMRYARTHGGFSVYVNAAGEGLGGYGLSGPDAVRRWLAASAGQGGGLR